MCMISPHHPTHEIEQTTTPGTSCPTLYDKCVGSLTSPADYKTYNTEDAGDGAYGLSSLSEKTWMSNHLQNDVISKATRSL